MTTTPGKKNKLIFDALFHEKETVEKEIGCSLEWERLDDKRASRIRRRFTNGGLDSPESWPALQENMIEVMIQMDKSLRPRLAKIIV